MKKLALTLCMQLWGLAAVLAAVVAAGWMGISRAACAGLGLLCLAGAGVSVYLAHRVFIQIKGYADSMEYQTRQSAEQLQQARHEIQELHLQLKLLGRRKTGIETILDSIQDGVVVSDWQDRIVLFNPAAAAILGISGQMMENRPIADWIAKTREGRLRHVRREFTLTGQGQTLVYDAVCSCVADETGQIQSVVTVLHDITREKEISQAKNDFVSHVSHELKTPLASINAYAEMLIDGEAQDDKTIQEFCTIIQGQAQRLNRLIEEMLNVSRIESGLMKVNRCPNSMTLIIRDAVEMMKSTAGEKNITIHSPAPIVYDQVSIDRDMMMQVVVNLLSNAVKYTPAGGSVAIDSQIDEADGKLTVSVSDTGVGIPAEDIPKLFAKFFRVEANKKVAKGTGLGLNLVKQIVETVHGGTVFVRSQQGKGSTFGFTLPLTAQTALSAVR